MNKIRPNPLILNNRIVIYGFSKEQIEKLKTKGKDIIESRIMLRDLVLNYIENKS